MNLLSRAFRLPLLLAGLTLALALPAAASAAPSPGTVELDQPAYTAHEAQGYLTITIVRRGDLSGQEHVGYGVKQQDAIDGIDFDAIPNTYLTMQPGQSSYTFNVKIIDRGMDGTPVHALAYLYGSWPATLGPNNNSMITILRDDGIEPRDPAQPARRSRPVLRQPDRRHEVLRRPRLRRGTRAAPLRALGPDLVGAAGRDRQRARRPPFLHVEHGQPRRGPRRPLPRGHTGAAAGNDRDAVDLQPRPQALRLHRDPENRAALRPLHSTPSRGGSAISTSSSSSSSTR